MWFLPDETDRKKTLTYDTQSSLIALLAEKHRDESHPKHPQLDVWHCDVVCNQANLFVSFAYQDNYIELVQALKALFMEQNLDDATTFMSFDMMVNNQFSTDTSDFDWLANTFSDAVKRIGRTVLFLSPCLNPTALGRGWCLYEISCSESLVIAVSPTQATSFYEMLTTNYEDVTNAIENIDLENCKCSQMEDQKRIFDVVKACRGGFDKFNGDVKKLLREWLCDAVLKKVPNLSASDVKLKDLADATCAAKLLDYFCSNFSQKMQLLEEIHKCSIDLLGEDNLETLNVQRNLACAHLGNFDYAKAELICRDVLRQCGEENHDLRYLTMESLAVALDNQGKFVEAGRFYSCVLNTQKTTLGSDHLNTLSTTVNFAGLLKKLNQLSEAEKLLKDALRGYQQIGELKMVHVAQSGLGSICGAQGRYDDAHALLLSAFRGQQILLGLRHPETLQTAVNLVLCNSELGNIDDGKALCLLVLRANRGNENKFTQQLKIDYEILLRK